MKSLSILKSFAVVLSLSLSAQSLALSDAQKDELLHKGTVTVEKGHFEVRFMMGGIDRTTKDAKEHWAHVAKLMGDLVRVEDFWHKKMVGRFFEGVDFASDCCKDGVCAIPTAFCATCEKNDKLTGFGSNAAKLKNWLEFCGTCMKDIAITVFGVPAGLLYAVVAPTATLLYRPIAAGTEAIVAGTMWPAIAYTIQGAEYVMVRNSPEPKEGDITVSYIPNRIENEFADNKSEL